jgi:hypothetical protein
MQLRLKKRAEGIQLLILDLGLWVNYMPLFLDQLRKGPGRPVVEDTSPFFSQIRRKMRGAGLMCMHGYSVEYQKF